MTTEVLQQQSGRIGQPLMKAAPATYSFRILMVNVCFLGRMEKGTDDWLLVDAGLPYSGARIHEQAKRCFVGRPKAIVLTHGHFDHVGALDHLSREWEVPIYAHEKELPYLNGESDYPPADPTVGGGWMARLSPLYPRKGLNLGSRVHPLPADGSVPFMPEWRWIHTPGHTPGHISLFRDSDRVLIAGDAFTTVKQESIWSVWTQHQEMHGPPAYFTIDWRAAGDSVKRLAELNPMMAVTGHGTPMSGEELANQLKRLANGFESETVPKRGRYIYHGRAQQD
ncbi:MBL fold metallo-hydrolase [Desmospora profundinema]|uniref:Glyoxylase-like metal-dependent hydrolase (Beta-lactamase superfamily II) n=1 Tax=Desmospora profundinema TaxID=1571184 RepID=A0ABU1IPH5_9BACL|nr:MBL fold metallo-hydrolase [Desmospora profundinema]MDR6226059.1 glyoxylase-like metal-dependent hydrolase (beta-lactamase superfamily II) [Desmospora profundinema]